MNLYEYDQRIAGIYAEYTDEETGAIKEEAFALIDALEMDKEAKTEGIALNIKNDKVLLAALKAEKDAIADRIAKLEKSIAGRSEYLQTYLGGEKFSTTKVRISYRPSTSVECDGEFVEWAKENGQIYLRHKETFEPNKDAIKDILKMGGKVPHAELVTRTSMTIK